MAESDSDYDYSDSDVEETIIAKPVKKPKPLVKRVYDASYLLDPKNHTKEMYDNEAKFAHKLSSGVKSCHGMGYHPWLVLTTCKEKKIIFDPHYKSSLTHLRNSLKNRCYISFLNIGSSTNPTVFLKFNVLDCTIIYFNTMEVKKISCHEGLFYPFIGPNSDEYVLSMFGVTLEEYKTMKKSERPIHEIKRCVRIRTDSVTF
jgi:hypothetical protein